VGHHEHRSGVRNRRVVAVLGEGVVDVGLVVGHQPRNAVDGSLGVHFPAVEQFDSAGGADHAERLGFVQGGDPVVLQVVVAGDGVDRCEGLACPVDEPHHGGVAGP
jgi:hypothetical protein